MNLVRLGSLVALLGFFAGVGVSACGDSAPPRESSGPLPFFDGGGSLTNDAGQSFGCPASAPKVGDRCGPGISASDRCTVPDGTCVRRGMVYDDFADFCCPVGFWERCGGGSDICLTPPDQPDAAGTDASTSDGGARDTSTDGP